ncbi:MAG: LysR family transcriptional regulator [Clostridiales bacterium]|nr:LysR family transcriptional regulator [Clostridiales bacterium]
MTIQQLRYFMTCASLRSFKTSAFISHCSPTTITRQIAALEDELGIKLFQRDTHKIQITDEGWIFFGHAMRILVALDDFDNGLVASGRKRPGGKPDFRVAVYTSDGTFGKIACAIEGAYPSEQIGKPYRFYHPHPGGMVEAVLENGYQVGVESRAILADYAGRVNSQLLYRSPFRLVVGSKAPLFGRKSISVEELVARYDRFGFFLPEPLGSPEIRERPITCAADLRELGEFLITQIPNIVPIMVRFDAPEDIMLLQPRQVSLNQSKETSSIRLEDDSIATDYMLFWKKEERDPALNVFLRLMARFAN